MSDLVQKSPIALVEHNKKAESSTQVKHELVLLLLLLVVLLGQHQIKVITDILAGLLIKPFYQLRQLLI